ncbi:unnamed protein product [Allacma fusca]|uniref:AB hydrolase-1 domain-containing protein n=1 Tax=Allacma fusca TaxID=39272 RepID=A0A8J2P8P8_9HEXA|nr:unnamed protein product [Allacma fusca]
MATLLRHCRNLNSNKWKISETFVFKQKRLIRTGSIEERKVRISGIPINFVEFGDGSHAILCLPGLVGSIQTDFAPIFQYFDQGKFRIVAWDPPGYGQSRPHQRQHSGNFYERDAQVALALMKKLGHEKFSLLGWSNGGMTAFTAAALYPTAIQNLVMWGTHAYLDAKSREFMNSIRHLRNWSPQMLSPALKVYDRKYLSELLDDWADATIKSSLGGINPSFAKYISQVSCPTLAIHGTKDKVLGADHCEFFRTTMKNCRVTYIRDGGHNLHLSKPREFVSIVESFLLGEVK